MLVFRPVIVCIHSHQQKFRGKFKKKQQHFYFIFGRVSKLFVVVRKTIYFKWHFSLGFVKKSKQIRSVALLYRIATPRSLIDTEGCLALGF